MKPLELSHDIIAKKIWERLPEIDKQLQVVKKSLVQRQKDWAAGKGSFLGAKELAAWEAPIERLGDSLDQEVLDFIDNSKVDVEKKEQEKANQIKKEAQRKRTLIFSIITVIGFFIAVGLAVWALQQKRIAEQALAELQVEKEKVADLESRLQEALEKNIAPRLEALKIGYDSADISKMTHRVLDSLEIWFPGKVTRPNIAQHRSSRQIANWYNEQKNLILIKDNEDALQNANLIQPGAIMFFGRSGEKYSNVNIELLTDQKKISQMGFVISVEKDAAGKVVKYTMFGARNPRMPASRYSGNFAGPGRVGQQFQEFPYGNWSQQWVAVAYPMGKED